MEGVGGPDTIRRPLCKRSVTETSHKAPPACIALHLNILPEDGVCTSAQDNSHASGAATHHENVAVLWRRVHKSALLE